MVAIGPTVRGFMGADATLPQIPYDTAVRFWKVEKEA